MATLRRLLLAASAAALLGGVTAAADTSPAPYAPLDRPGPALSVSSAKLAAALHCTSSVDHASREPILLIPGTDLDPDPNFSWNYERAFTSLKWP